jgi:hypothetical protein
MMIEEIAVWQIELSYLLLPVMAPIVLWRIRLAEQRDSEQGTVRPDWKDTGDQSGEAGVEALSPQEPDIAEELH